MAKMITELNRITKKMPGYYPGGETVVAFQPNETVQAKCATCDDTGFFLPAIAMGERGFGRALPCPCGGAKKDPEKLIKLSGVPKGQRHYTFDYFAPISGKKMVAQAVSDMVKKGSGLIYLWGDFGRGKSGLGKAAALATCDDGKLGVFAEMLDILEYQMSWAGTVDEQSESEREEKRRLGRLSAAKTLVIDEFDRTTNSDWVKSKVFSIINKRYDNRDRQLTILISNKSVADLKPHLGWLVSRMGDAMVLKVVGQDLRGSGR